MGAGTLIGLAGAVERVAGEVAASLAAPRRILTGGDAARLRAALGEGWELDPQLTLRGLRAAVEESCAG
jgi:pantothenate kinase type III